MKSHPLSEKDVSSSPYVDRVGLVYARVSSKKQETEGSGLSSQEGRCVNDLKLINVPHLKTFADSFTGGGDFMKRPAMRELLAFVDANPHKKFLVVFDDLARFARDVQFHLKLKAIFKSRDVLLRCLNYNFDDSPEGEYAELIMAGNAELARKQNRRQVVQKMKARLEAGYWAFSRRKGYDIVKDPMHGKLAIPNKDGLDMLKPALEGFAKGTLARKIDVSRFLMEKGFWKKRRDPDRYIDEVTKHLQDSFYAGYLEYPKWDVARRQGRHEALISLATFELIQKRLKKETVGGRVRRDVSDDFPMRGLVKCGECEQKLTGCWSKGRKQSYAYYYCHNKKCIQYGKMCSKDTVESEFDVLLKTNELRPEVGHLLSAVFDRVWKQEVVSVKKQVLEAQWKVRDLQEDAGRLAKAAAKTNSDRARASYENEMEQIMREVEKLDAGAAQEIDLDVPYRTALEKAVGLVKSPYKVWRKLDAIEKQRLFFFLFEDKLAYIKASGYRTANIPTAARLFEDFVVSNSALVDPTGIEPVTSSMPWKRSTK